ncbi:ABC-2 transporter permease [bacterium]|nr:MAG: ABC-2 transporter permease [bacterium]
MSALRALIQKDLRLFFADRKAVLITFAVPIGIASFMGSLQSGMGDGTKVTKAIPILVADSDNSELSRAFVAKLKAGGLLAPTASTLEKAEAAVRSGKASVAVEIPKGFGKEAPNAMFGGKAPDLTLRYDPSNALEMQAAQGSVMQAAMETVSAKAFGAGSSNEWLKDVEASPDLSEERKDAFRGLSDSLQKVDATGAGEGSGDGGGMQQPFVLKKVAATAAKTGNDYSGLAHMFAGMAVQGVLFFAIDSAMGLLRDRRLGIWRRLRVSPITLGQMLAGKIAASSLLALFVLSGVLLFGRLVFKIELQGSALGLGLVLAATSVMTACFGLFVAALGRTETQSRGLSVLAVLVMSMLGGAWFPSFLMPSWVQPISMLTPSRWAVDGFDAMLWRGGGLTAALQPSLILLVFAAVFAAVAYGRFATIKE